METGTYPEVVDYLLDWFRQLDTWRTHGQFGPCPLSFTDIMNWKSLYSVDIEPWELMALKELDLTFLKACRDKPKGTNDAGSGPT